MDQFENTRVLLVGAYDDAMHAHTALRRRALERLGCRVTSFNLVSQGGLLNRLRRIGLHDRMAKALRQTDPEVVLVLEGSQMPPELVAELKRESQALWVNWFCDERRSRNAISTLAAAYDLVFVAGSEVVENGDTVGLPPLRYLPPGCDPSVHRPMRSRDQFRANVVFAGTATATPGAAALRAGGVRARAVGTGVASDAAARLLPRRAVGPRGLRPGLRGRVGGGQRPVLRCGRRPGPGLQPAALRAGRDRRAPGGGGSSRHPSPLPRGLGAAGCAHPRPISRRCSRRRCRIGPGRSRWPQAPGSGRWASTPTCTGWPPCSAQRG